MKNKTSSTIWIIVMTICIGYLIATSIQDAKTASSENLSKVITKAEKSPETKAEIAKFIKNNPSPSNSELKAMNKYVEQIAVRDLARKTTGDITIQAEYKIEQEKDEKAQAELTKAMEKFTFNVAGVNINILLVVLALAMMSLLFKFARSGMYDR